MYYKDMEIWKESIKLVTDVYKIVQMYPKTELFSIVNQIKKSVISVPSNISEGMVKHSDRETLRFLDIAPGSLAELDTQLLISEQLGFTDKYNELEKQISKVRALLSGVIKHYEKLINNQNIVP